MFKFLNAAIHIISKDPEFLNLSKSPHRGYLGKNKQNYIVFNSNPTYAPSTNLK